MSLMLCRSCSTKFAVGLLRCPQCSAVSELYAVPDYLADAEEENMPKITVAAGASNALGDAGEPAADVVPGLQVVAEPEPAVQQEEAQSAPAEATPEAPETAEGDSSAESVDGATATDATPPAPKKRAARKTASPPAAGT